jgi:REP element-mobilizing transposase RayT
MSHSFSKIWVHAIWSTKNWTPLIETKIEKQVYNFMTDQFVELGCPVKIINGMPDHVHCLFLLNSQKSISDVLKQVKGSTSHSINQQDLIVEKFAWQVGFGAYSVSYSELEKIYLYIKNQKVHHTKKTFQQEYEEFLKFHGFDI